MLVSPLNNYDRILEPPPDKSIMQRAVIIGAMKGGIEIENPSFCLDALSAIDCVKALGAPVELIGGILKIGKINPPKGRIRLDAGNSATAMRLLLGAAAGLGLEIEISGDESLNQRSMKDTIEALETMGASIEHNNFCASLINIPSRIKATVFEPKNPSAQVKSAVLLASQNAKIIEKIKTRDHTERLLKHLDGGERGVRIAGDISAAAYPVALALLIKGGRVHIKNVGLNPLRTGMIDVLIAAGANIEIIKKDDGFEPFGDIIARFSPDIKPFEINEKILPTLIDEVPVLAVIACFCKGESVFSGLKALRNKESDRLKAIERYLNAKTNGDNLVIKGKTPIPYNIIDSKDHRIVMSMAVAGLASGGCEAVYPDCVSVSYPRFFEDICL